MMGRPVIIGVLTKLYMYTKVLATSVISIALHVYMCTCTCIHILYIRLCIYTMEVEVHNNLGALFRTNIMADCISNVPNENSIPK